LGSNTFAQRSACPELSFLKPFALRLVGMHRSYQESATGRDAWPPLPGDHPVTARSADAPGVRVEPQEAQHSSSLRSAWLLRPSHLTVSRLLRSRAPRSEDGQLVLGGCAVVQRHRPDIPQQQRAARSALDVDYHARRRSAAPALPRLCRNPARGQDRLCPDVAPVARAWRSPLTVGFHSHHPC
jgi:hypothetical protein